MCEALTLLLLYGDRRLFSNYKCEEVLTDFPIIYITWTRFLDPKIPVAYIVHLKHKESLGLSHGTYKLLNLSDGFILVCCCRCPWSNRLRSKRLYSSVVVIPAPVRVPTLRLPVTSFTSAVG